MSMQKNHNVEPVLSFEFANVTGEVTPILFRNPLKVLQANTVEGVLQSLHTVQEAVNSGYYAAGFLTYESAAAFDSAYKVKNKTDMPLLWFGIFSKPEKGMLLSERSYTLTNWEPNITLDEYNAAFKKIKTYIKNGAVDQTNFTIRLYSQFQGDAIALFEKMKRAQNAKYSAYIHTGEYSILSASPELFFQLNGDEITTKPMKGTVKRGKTSEEDEAFANWLYYSEKNRAENEMIVDLFKDDLSSIAEAGTIKVTQLFDVEKYPTVHQMTSTITAKVRNNIEIVDIFKALFPSGSITGSPKARTMEIIDEAETTPRGVYCGAIGYITPNKEAIFNVPIRTAVINHRNGRAIYGVGGGITMKSTAQDEYEEIIAKSTILEEERPDFHLLETMLLHNGEYFLLEEHVNRLKRSAQYFDFRGNVEDIRAKLAEFAQQNNLGRLKVRLLVDKNGKMTMEGQAVTRIPGPVKASLAKEPVDKENPFLYHKTTNRVIYEYFQRKNPHVFDVLLWNEEKELTEFTFGNVVLEFGGQFFTPPVDSGLLGGTYREKLLKTGKIKEKKLTIDDLEKCTKLWFINSVREWLEVELVKD